MLTISPIFIVDAGCAAVDVFCGAAGAAVRLPLACKVVAKVTVKFSAYLGMSNPVRSKLALEAEEELPPGLLSFRHCSRAPSAVCDAQKVIDCADLHRAMNT
jgi:hypothetical protein